MPFMGKDWRSPGEAWVKTDSLGWQRLKIIESQLYLTACHQNHSACSWPPRSQYGQHMADHCNKQKVIDSCDRAGGKTNGYHPIDTIEHASPNNKSSSGSSRSSEQSSASTSPTSFYDKNGTVHHIHPITISSPYGQFSTSCCAHHLVSHGNSSDTGSRPKTACYRNLSSSGAKRADLLDSSKGCTLKSINLSREMIHKSDLESANRTDVPLLPHNSSVSDFIISHTDAQDVARPSVADVSTKTNCMENLILDGSTPETSSKPGNPLIMKNGTRIDNEEFLEDSVALSTNSLSGSKFNIVPISDSHPNNDGISSTSPATLCQNSQDRYQCSPCEYCCFTNQNPNHPIIQDARNPKAAPHCRISVRTREVAMHNTLGEAFYRLDFYNAIRDIRRFNYISKLLHLMITQNLTSLSGCATKVLFTLLEQVAWEVSSNKRNIHVIRNLLHELKQTIQKYQCWGRPIGSTALWQQHYETIERISQIVNEIELSPPKSDITFDKLPVEVIREILLKLNDYRDLVNSARASPVMQSMIDNQNVWRKLCRYHFNDQQLKLALEMADFKFAKKPILRGIKYARTTSADGRSCYRNPVTQKQSTSTANAIRQQIQEASSSSSSRRRGASSIHNESNKSYVTNAVKMFDRESSSSAVRSVQARGRLQSQIPHDGGQVAECAAWDVDWELVFHQLRKRYDLKEEYADCLLLCRHCRCLFWRSFGHPCINNDQSQEKGCTTSADDVLNNNIAGCRDRLNPHLQVEHNNDEARGRVSVAVLSRNFDRQAQEVPADGSNAENLAPSDGDVLQACVSDRAQQRVGQPRRALGALIGAQHEQRSVERQRQRQQISAPSGRLNPSIPNHVTITPQAFLKFFSL